MEELQALGEVSQAVNSTLELETVLTTIVGRAVQLSRRVCTSSNNRTFSMAMTAWSAKLNLLICEWADSGLHQHEYANWMTLAQHRDPEHSAVTT